MSFEVGKTYQTAQGNLVTIVDGGRYSNGVAWVKGHDSELRFADTGRVIYDQESCYNLVRHPTTIVGRTPQQMAEVIGDLRYDALEAFLYALALKLLADSRADKERGRWRLAEELRMAGTKLRDTVVQHLWRAWDVSEPHMRDDVKHDAV